MPGSRSSTSCSRPPSTPPPASTPMPSSALNSEHRLLPEPTAPDLFAHAFRWHEKFLPPVQQGDRLLLASERDTLALGSAAVLDRKSTRLNSSHSQISYAVFCLKKKKK